MNKSKNTITPKQNQELITEKNLSIIEEKLIDGMTLSEIINDKQYPFSLMKFYHYLKNCNKKSMLHTAKYMHQILSLSNDAYEEIFQEIDMNGLIEKKGIQN